jgi:hypothetical protein
MSDAQVVTEGRLLDIVDEAWARSTLEVDGARARRGVRRAEGCAGLAHTLPRRAHAASCGPGRG